MPISFIKGRTTRWGSSAFFIKSGRHNNVEGEAEVNCLLIKAELPIGRGLNFFNGRKGCYKTSHLLLFKWKE
jgi:hypothetical protein